MKKIRVTFDDLSFDGTENITFEMPIEHVAEHWAHSHTERYIQTGDAETEEQAYEIALELALNDDERLLDWFVTSFSITDYREFLRSEFNVSPDDYTDEEWLNANAEIINVSKRNKKG